MKEIVVCFPARTYWKIVNWCCYYKD